MSEDDIPIWMPMAHFGPVGTPLPDWQDEPDDDPDSDDEELPETPPDVVQMLGFDPRKEPGWDEPAEKEAG